MKIISKYKDYYDYLQGVYGVDNYKVYTRSNIIMEKDFELKFDLEDKKKTNQHFFYSFAINNKFYVIVKTLKGIFPISKKLLEDLGYSEWSIKNVLDYSNITNANKLLQKPILVSNGIASNIKDWEADKDPLMKSFSFHKILSAQELYIEVETFLGWVKDNPPIPNNQTNKEKIISNGFDLKQSFRHRKTR